MKFLIGIGDIWLQISIVIKAKDHSQSWIFIIRHQQPLPATNAGIANIKDLLKAKKLERPEKRKEAELRQNLEKGPTHGEGPGPEKGPGRLDQSLEIVQPPEMLEKKSKPLDQLVKKPGPRCQKG